MTLSNAARPPRVAEQITDRPAAETGGQTFTWRERRSVFELSSPDSELMTMAERIFGHSAMSSAGVPHRCWWIERAETGGTTDADMSGEESWIVSMYDEGATPPSTTRHSSREFALVSVEGGALDHLLENNDDVVAVHAALLSRKGRGLVVVGRSFSGKSTLAAALWRSGWTLHGDELAFLHGDSASGSAARRRISLRDTSRNLVGEDLWQRIQRTPSCMKSTNGYLFHAHEENGASPGTETGVDAIVFLARRGAVVLPAAISPMNPARAALALLPYAHKTRTLPFVEAMRQISPIAEKIAAYDLGRGELADMVGAVDALVDRENRAAVALRK